MGLLRAASRDRFRFEDLFTTPGYEQLAVGVRSLDWPAIEAALRALAPDDLSGGFNAFLHINRRGLQPILETAPSSDFAPTVAAFHRTGTRQFNAEIRREWAVRSERDLFAVVSEHPDFWPATVGRILLGRLLGLDASELRRRYEDLQAIKHDDFHGTSHYFQSLLPKWGGTPAAALDFARRRTSEASSSSLTPYLVAAVHLELSGESRSDDYFDSAVISELLDASHAAAFEPSGPLSPDEVVAHNAFAAAFVKAGRPAEAARHFAAIGPRGNDWFWWSVRGGSRASGVERIRRTMLAKGAR